MGVKDLWVIAGPCEERISLHDLRGQTLAVDLAGWVVQNQTVPGLSYRVARPHLRNLIFRTSSLISLDILPVFVLDGEPPKVKSATVASRNRLNWGPSSRPAAPPSLEQSPKVQKRRQFSGVLKECGELLKSLGVPVLTAPGEAEAFCAALNRAGLVDGVISDDSDTLCYGARTVYRNFSTDPKNFSVSKYSSKRLKYEQGLSRERIVIMALILGCDYVPGGVNGVGKDNLFKLFQHWGTPFKGELKKVLDWDDEDYIEIKKQTHCGTCGHPGTVGQHRKGGCGVCPHSSSHGCISGIPCPCDYHSPETQRNITESSIRRKAVESEGWPRLEVVEEFFKLDAEDIHHSFIWRCPDPAGFIKICETRLDWEREYSLDKVQDIVTRWQVRHPGDLSIVIPCSVIKTRIQGGQNMLEVEWNSSNPTLPSSFTSCVPTSDFETAFPELLNQFIEIRENKKKKKNPKKNKENNDPTAAKTKKVVGAKTTKGIQPTITKFLSSGGGVKVATNTLSVEPSTCSTLSNTCSAAAKTEISLKPKNAQFRKINKVVVGSCLVEAAVPKVKGSDVFSVEDSLLQEMESMSISNTEYSWLGQKSRKHDETNLGDYLEETYNSEMSGILDEIMGNSQPTPGNSEKPFSVYRGNNIDLNNSSSSYFNQQMTSTPELRGRISRNNFPLKLEPKFLKSTPETSRDPSPDNSPDNSPVRCAGDKWKAEQSGVGEDTFDKFDEDASKCTPLLERVKKRMGK